MIGYYLFHFLLFGVALFSMYSVIRLFIMLLLLHRYDELQKKAVYESFALSFLIILLLHFVQLNINLFDIDWPLLITTGNRLGIAGGNVPKPHFDSFFFDCFVLAVVYLIKKRRYGV
ncbi:hypothetical protein [Vagococcus fluvialis]|uniref:hypothetical protein n=1 Tax=Vagococcus fluvialis TaxID=2738 RepID=UPI000B35FB78|nr:hypothetical protein [Vagococcus fluvialis]